MFQLPRIARRFAYSAPLRSSVVSTRAPAGMRALSSSTDWTYASAHAEIFGKEEPRVAFLGTGPMALSFAAQLLSAAEAHNARKPKIVLLTEQPHFYDGLRAHGFTVVDERDGTKYEVPSSDLVVVRSPQEYEALHPNEPPPQLVFGTMQSGAKKERWSLAKPGANGRQVVALTAANGMPFTTMLEELLPRMPQGLRTGHATAYVKARVNVTRPLNERDKDKEDGAPHITVTCTDAGRISVGAVGPGASDQNAWFGSVAALLDGPLYESQVAKNAKHEAMTKVVRNLTNAICLASTVAQYQFSGSPREVVPMRYGVHLEKKCFANALNKATFEAGRALGWSAQEIAYQIVENLKYVMGPVPENKDIDLDKMLHSFEDGLEDILRLRKSDDGTYSRNALFEKLSDKVLRTQLFNKISRTERGSTHPPTDAQAAALIVHESAEGGTEGAMKPFGAMVPTKPIENKVQLIIDAGLESLNLSEDEARRTDMTVLYGINDLYNAYNAAVAAQQPCQVPPSFFQLIEGCEDETRLLSNIDQRVLKHDWRSAEAKSRGGISVSAQRKQWLGESAIRNAKLIGQLTAEGLSFLRFDVGGVSLPEHPDVIAARVAVAAGHHKYSPLCEDESLEALAKFYSDTSNGRVFSPKEVMVLGMRAKGALPWMLDFVGNGPMFVPRPTYNPNPSAGLYHSRQVLSFDVTGPHRYLPMIHALKRHKGGGVVVLPIIGNPLSTTLTEEEEAGFIEVLKANQRLAFVADHAYRGYNKMGDVNDQGGLTDINGVVTRDVMEHGGFYDESPLDPKTGKLKHLRLTLHSSSKLFNDASGPGTCAGHADTTAFLGDMLRGSYTQAHARDRKVIPAIVNNLDYNACSKWMANMDLFSAKTQGKVPGFRDLGYDCPPFLCYDASEYLAKHDLSPEKAQQYFMSRSPGLCGIFGGFGPGSLHVFRLGFTGETDPERVALAAEKFVEYVNDLDAIEQFKAHEDDLTKNYYRLLEIVDNKGA